jgi:ubiquinol oxidase
VSLPQSIRTINRLAIGAVKNILALFYGDRHFARFAALETIARVPYFSYTSVLHLYETFGWFREKEYIKIHFSESWNELHHLLIMEELGGNKYFMDRTIAHIIAFFYYWLVVVLYMIAPAVAYDLNKQVEIHAFDTYKAFLSSHEHELKNRVAPQSAIDYYENEDPYLIDAFHSDNLNVRKLSNATDISPREKNRPKKLQNLYDVFERICEDEAEHTKTMNILQRDMIIRRQMKRKRLNWPDCKKL